MFVDLDVINGIASGKRVSDMTSKEWEREYRILAENPALKELADWQLSEGKSGLSDMGELKTKLAEAQKSLQENHPEVLEELQRGD